MIFDYYIVKFAGLALVLSPWRRLKNKMVATIVLNIEYYRQINKKTFLEITNINCQFIKIMWTDNRMSRIKMKISRIRIVNVNNIKYPFQMKNHFSTKLNTRVNMMRIFRDQSLTLTIFEIKWPSFYVWRSIPFQIVHVNVPRNGIVSNRRMTSLWPWPLMSWSNK